MNAYLLGFLAELRAARYVKARGGRIVARRYRACGGEIDLIARYGAVIAFIEVKSRPNARMGAGFEAVNADKRRRLRRASLSYLQSRGLEGAPCRFDLLEITRAGTQYMESAF